MLFLFIQERKLKKEQTHPRNPVKFDGVEDMAELGYLNEPGVLHNLRTRYNSDRIYVSSCLMLITLISNLLADLLWAVLSGC